MWMYPDMVQSLVEGGYYYILCLECKQSIIVKDHIMINTPKGIVTVPKGPPEKLAEILIQLEIMDEAGIPFSSEEISARLKYKLDRIDQNPFLWKKAGIMEEPRRIFEEFEREEERNQKEKNRRFRFL